MSDHPTLHTQPLRRKHIGQILEELMEKHKSERPPNRPPWTWTNRAIASGISAEHLINDNDEIKTIPAMPLKLAVVAGRYSTPSDFVVSKTPKGRR